MQVAGIERSAAGNCKVLLLLQNRLSAAVCQQRKLSNEVVHLFSEGQPAEVVLTNCAALEPDAMALFLRDVATPR